MFLVLWEFEVKPECEERLERVYGAGGDWDSLFRRDAHHERTELFRHTDRPRIYLTADYWKSRKSYEEFLQARGAEYKELDSIAEELTANERHIGSYEIVVP
jgi:antibiotic biosynthesis monooxygenase